MGMLVLSRKRGEEILIEVPGFDQPIVLTLVDMHGHHARIGIDAPKEVAIYRKEIRDRFPSAPPAPSPNPGVAS